MLILRFMRFKILFTCSLIVVLGSAAGGGLTWMTLLSCCLLALWYVHAATTNDYADRHIDAINLKGKSQRPLASGMVSVRQLWQLHIIAGTLALIISSFYGLELLYIAIIVFIYDYAYSLKPFRLSHRGAIAQLTLPLAYVYFSFSLGYFASSQSEPYPLALMFGLYAGFVARLFLKDYRDVEGDKKYGKSTFLIRHGNQATCVMSNLFALASLILFLSVIDFILGASIVLILGHIYGMRLLRALVMTNEVTQQVSIVKQAAIVANASLIVVLFVVVLRQYTPEEQILISWLPLVAWALFIVTQLNKLKSNNPH